MPRPTGIQSESSEPSTCRAFVQKAMTPASTPPAPISLMPEPPFDSLADFSWLPTLRISAAATPSG